MNKLKGVVLNQELYIYQNLNGFDKYDECEYIDNHLEYYDDYNRYKIALPDCFCIIEYEFCKLYENSGYWSFVEEYELEVFNISMLKKLTKRDKKRLKKLNDIYNNPNHINISENQSYINITKISENQMHLEVGFDCIPYFNGILSAEAFGCIFYFLSRIKCKNWKERFEKYFMKNFNKDSKKKILDNCKFKLKYY